MSLPLTTATTLHRLALPARADAAPSAEIRAYADLRNRSLLETTGRDDQSQSAEQLQPVLQSTPETTRAQWYIQEGDALVGLAAMSILGDDDGRTAFITVNVLRSHWSRGIGTAALAHLESETRAAGVERLLVWTEHSGDAEPLPSPTGFGSVPRDHTAAFLLRSGFELGQVERVSAFTFSEAAMRRLQNLRSDAEQHSEGYRIVQWTIPTPTERVAEFARMKEHMSTDVPDADLDMPAEIWDAERIARNDERWAQRGFTVLVTAAEHIATGELCAYNELAIGPDPTAPTHQEDTLVLSAHRGHRLGMLVKTAGLLTWYAQHAASDRVVTYNAEENRPMLAINESMGFHALGYEGAWKKELR